MSVWMKTSMMNVLKDKQGNNLNICFSKTFYYICAYYFSKCFYYDTFYCFLDPAGGGRDR